MSAFENAQRFFHACETPLGWEGCQAYVADGASFVAQSEPLVEVKTVQAYCEWIKGFGTVTAAGAHYELHAQGYDEAKRQAVFLRPTTPPMWAKAARCLQRTKPRTPTMCMC